MASLIDDEILESRLVPDPSFDPLVAPDELRRRLGLAAWEFEQANRKLRELESRRVVREKQTRIILLAKRWDLIQNERLRLHLLHCYEDEKFKPTKEDLESFIFIEHREIFDEYNYFEKLAKQANREFEMWQSQLMWYQSKMKHDRLEQMAEYSGG